MSTDPSFHMTIVDVFSIRGRGTVVTGKIDAGAVKAGDEVVLRTQQGEKRTSVLGIESFKKTVQEARAGDSVGILLKDIAREDAQRGDELLGPGSDFTWAP